jgi:hypothetical protein
MTDEELMAVCAIRYTIGRRSYIVADGARWALQYGTASKAVRDIVVRDLEEEIDRQERTGLPALGHSCDEELWRTTLEQLRVLA